MTYNESLDFIHGIPRFSKKLGLDKIEKLLAMLGNPHKKLKFVHVAGTNGKGSTCTMLSYVLKEAGYKTGLYTSPFVLNFRERMQINNEMIEQEELAELTQKVKEAWEIISRTKEDAPSEFEVVFAVALLYFVKHDCDIAVIEVGMGGRYDATNIIPPPLVAAIASIGIDHAAILGDSISKIAREKAGIIKENSLVVSYPKQPIEALEVIMEAAAGKGDTVVVPGNAEIIESNFLGNNFNYGANNYFVRLIGEHQICNALVVIECVKGLAARGFSISVPNIREGIAKAFIPARIEVMSENPLIILDGAHNIDGAKTLSSALKKLENKRLIGLVGMVNDKEADKVMRELSVNFAQIITTVDPHNKSRFFGAKELAEIAGRYCPNVGHNDNPADALKQILRCLKDNEAVVICGSLYLASYIRPKIGDIINATRSNEDEGI